MTAARPTESEPANRPGRAGLPLRVRVALAFAGLGLVVVGVTSVTTHVLARGYLLDQRTDLATRQAYVNARLARDLVVAAPDQPDDAVQAIGSDGAVQALLLIDGEWYSSSVSVDPSQLPADLLEFARAGSAARRRIEVGGATALAVAIPLGAASAVFVEVAPLDEIRRTLGVLRAALVVGSVGSAAASAVLGWFVADRLVRPLRRLSHAATRIAGGELGTRLRVGNDPDVDPLAASFNVMLDSLQARIDRDARFAAEVSHELRTPLTTLAAGIELAMVDAERLPDAQRRALELVRGNTAAFQRLVLDLLEISRLDAGSDAPALEPVDVLEFLAGVARRSGAPTPEFSGGGSWVGAVDKVRVERIVTNLVENAARYGGGATALRVERAPGWWSIVVEDHGPGIPAADRERVFERFWRGAAARQTGAAGSGLGLSIVAQHVRLLGGEVRLDEGVPRGTRAVVRFPWREVEE